MQSTNEGKYNKKTVKKPKASKGSTVSVTVDLFKECKNIEQVADTRGVAIITIE
ncbi:MAG: hypothetical protein U9Q15_00315 [Patescibacteria group bacterium]|nr:hypothetical protein [Patescibacteria group bacterium]